MQHCDLDHKTTLVPRIDHVLGLGHVGYVAEDVNEACNKSQHGEYPSCNVYKKGVALAAIENMPCIVVRAARIMLSQLALV